MAEKVTGRSSHPSTNWLTWMYTFLPTGGAPTRTVYGFVMSAAPCTAPGHRPRTRKSRQISRPWLTGLEPRTMVFAPGSVGQPNLRAPALNRLAARRAPFLREKRAGFPEPKGSSPARPAPPKFSCILPRMVASLRDLTSWAAQVHNLQSERGPFRATPVRPRPDQSRSRTRLNPLYAESHPTR